MVSNFNSALLSSLALLGDQPSDDEVEPDSPVVPLYERQCQELSLSGSPVAALLLDRLCLASEGFHYLFPRSQRCCSTDYVRHVFQMPPFPSVAMTVLHN